MKWQVKAAAQAVLSRVPMGRVLHRRLQDAAGTARLDLEAHYESKARFLRRGIEAGMDVEGRTFLDIGTGWHPILPLMLHVLGARGTVTIDVNPWLTRESLAETFTVLHGASARIAADFALHDGRVRATLGRLALLSRDPSLTTEDLLRAADIEYRCPVDAGASAFPSRSFDGVLSFNVLEHVPPDVIAAILRESRRILTADGFHLHHVGLSDHFSHVDGRITSVNFLRYSDRAWYWIGGSGLAYHNRLRGVDFVRLFQREGFDVLQWDAPVDRAALEAIQRGEVAPHPRYADYTPEELSGYVLNLVARKQRMADAVAA